MSNGTYGKTLSDYPVSSPLQDNGQIGFSGFPYPSVFNRVESTLSHRHRFVYTGIWEPLCGQVWSHGQGFHLHGGESQELEPLNPEMH
jgi:hypothetical protein